MQKQRLLAVLAQENSLHSDPENNPEQKQKSLGSERILLLQASIMHLTLIDV